IPEFFSRAYNATLRSAAEFVNNLADIVNKPLRAIGREGIGKVNWGASQQKELVNLADAARAGWENAAKGVGAYEALIGRVNARLDENARKINDQRKEGEKTKGVLGGISGEEKKLTAE